MSDEELLFAEDSELDNEETTQIYPWRILIVDDEEDIHTVTKMALTSFEFQGRGAEFISAYSGQEA